MNGTPPPAAPGPVARPVLALDREELHLSSPRGEVARGAFTLSNRGDAPLEGTVAIRVGGTWLRAEPAGLRLAPGEARRVEVQADPTTLASGYTRGEIDVVSSGGTATLPVRIGVRTGRSWRLLAVAVAASVALAAITGLLLAGVKLPAAAPAVSAPAARAHGRAHARRARAPLPSFNRQAALAAIRHAIIASNAAWQAALTHPSTADLGTVKTGQDLARAISDVEELLAGGEHWQIGLHSFRVRPGSVGVSDDDTRGWGVVEKTERRALYGPDHPRVPYELSDASYVLRYSLVRQNGRWLVDDVAVDSVTPIEAAAPTLSVQQVAARVLPSVMHVEADLSQGTAVGTGIVIHSSATSSDVITNDHVVSGHSAVRLQRWLRDHYDPPSPWTASKVWEDAADDLAVIRIDQGNLPVAPWGDSTALLPGQEVVAIGYAENLSGGPTVTDGIVSSVLRTSPDNPTGPTYIGHSATINHGNSGGPLADMSGRIVGINTWTLDNTQGLFFAIPSARAARMAAGTIGSNG